MQYKVVDGKYLIEFPTTSRESESGSDSSHQKNSLEQVLKNSD